MSFPRYPKYKASGVEWLGDVPEGWGVVQYKQFVDIQNGSDHKHVEQPEGYPVFGSGGVFAYASEFLYDGESVLLGRKGTIDKPLYVTGRFWTVDTMYWTKIRPNTSGRFVYYLATTIPFDYYSTNTALPSMTKGALSHHFVPTPSLPEQTAIAEFLDRETGKIDELVAEQRRLMELLKEKRQAVISHAVTKGLNPHAPMKPSGIEWLGDVPEHWGVLNLRYVFEIKAGGDLKEESFSKDKSDEHPYPIYTNSVKPDEIYGFTSKQLFKANTVTVTGRGDIGHATYRDHEYDAIIRLLVLTPTRNEPCKYYAYFINSVIKFLGGNTAVSQLSAEQISPYKVLSPTILERQAIVAFLEIETAKFDTLTAEAQRAIDLLQERRTALISAAVTGQIDVRNHAPKN